MIITFAIVIAAANVPIGWAQAIICLDLLEFCTERGVVFFNWLNLVWKGYKNRGYQCFRVILVKKKRYASSERGEHPNFILPLYISTDIDVLKYMCKFQKFNMTQWISWYLVIIFLMVLCLVFLKFLVHQCISWVFFMH